MKAQIDSNRTIDVPRFRLRAIAMSNSELGRWSSFAVFLVGLAYIVALVIGFATRGLSAPIVDPLLAIMEVLTLIAAPLMLVMMAAIHGRASDERKTIGSLAFAFMLLTTGTTSAVHFVNLTATRQLGSALLVWPSPAYALGCLRGMCSSDSRSSSLHLRFRVAVARIA